MGRANRGGTLIEPLTFAAGVASRGAMTAHWVEEASLAAPSLQAKGSLYVVASGTPTETDAALKAMRDQYYGEVGPPTDVATSLREAAEAVNTLLLRQHAIGVSCLAAVISDGARLTVVAVGAGAAYLFSPTDGAIDRLVDPSSALLGAQPVLGVAQATRHLHAGDVLVLLSAALAEALEPAEIGIVSAQAGNVGPQGVADQLLARAYGDTPGGSATAVVVACQTAIEARLGGARSPTPASIPGRTAAPPRRRPAEEPPSLQARLGEPDRGRPLLRWLVGGAIAVALLTGGAYAAGRWLLPGADTTSTSFPTTALPSPEAPPVGPAVGPLPVGTPAPGTEAAWRRINELWPEGDKGTIAAIQEIVGLLEQLQARSPADFDVAEKLAVARTNLAYRRGMRDVDRNWPTTTAASTVMSWSVVVETLEDLYRQALPPAYRTVVTTKLYAGLVNYATALQNANRPDQAQGNLRRAYQIRPP